ncbi:hypothetical protein ACJX0J_016101, partial [Zea mays]
LVYLFMQNEIERIRVPVIYLGTGSLYFLCHYVDLLCNYSSTFFIWFLFMPDNGQKCHHVDLFCNYSSTFFIWVLRYKNMIVNERRAKLVIYIVVQDVYVYLNMHMRPLFSIPEILYGQAMTLLFLLAKFDMCDNMLTMANLCVINQADNYVSYVIFMIIIYSTC